MCAGMPITRNTEVIFSSSVLGCWEGMSSCEYALCGSSAISSMRLYIASGSAGLTM